MKLLLDGDIVVFRAGMAAERAKWYLRILPEGQTQEFQYKNELENALDLQCPGKMSRVEGEDYELWSERHLEPVENALHNVKSIINTMLENLQMSEWDLEVYLSGKGEENNFRYAVAVSKPYKGNRKGQARPTHEQAIRDYLQSKYLTHVSIGEEADDALGIRQTQEGPSECIIATLDKDIDMIPGLKYNFVEDESYSITEEQGYYNFLIQLMMGDTTDNIPGLPKIGKVKAVKALEGVPRDEWWDVVLGMYERHNPVTSDDWWEYLREQGKLLWIRRKPNEDWEPEKPDSSPSLSLY